MILLLAAVPAIEKLLGMFVLVRWTTARKEIRSLWSWAMRCQSLEKLRQMRGNRRAT